MIQILIKPREYTSTDPFASFDNLNVKPCAGEINGGGESGNTGAEDEDVREHEFVLS
jgi:hypothetical protein